MDYSERLFLAIGEARDAQRPENLAQLEQLESSIDSLVGSSNWTGTRNVLAWPRAILAIWPHPRRAEACDVLDR